MLFVDKDGQGAEGRWFTGAQDEFGADVQLTRVESDPLLLGTAQALLKAGSEQSVQIFGANLPTGVQPAALSLGPGVTVDRVESAAADRITVRVTVAPDAPPGRRTLLVAGVRGEASLGVYSSIDFIKVRAAVRPRPGRRRQPSRSSSSSSRRARSLNGPTANRTLRMTSNLDLVDAAWSIEEYTATYDDDDKDFVRHHRRGPAVVHAQPRWPESETQNTAPTTRRRVGRRARTRRRHRADRRAALQGRAHLLVTLRST